MFIISGKAARKLQHPPKVLILTSLPAFLRENHSSRRKKGKKERERGRENKEREYRLLWYNRLLALETHIDKGIGERQRGSLHH